MCAEPLSRPADPVNASDIVQCPCCGGTFHLCGSAHVQSMVTPEAAAKLLGISRKRVYDLMSNGTIPPKIIRTFGRQKRLLAQGLSRWINEGGLS